MLWEKVVATELRLMLPSLCAENEAPVGPAISQFGINATDLCSSFNEMTQELDFEEYTVFLNVKAYRDDTNIGDFFLHIDSYVTSSLLESLCFKFQLKKRKKKKKQVLFIRDILSIAKFNLAKAEYFLYLFNCPGLFPFLHLENEFKSVLSTAMMMRHAIFWI